MNCELDAAERDQVKGVLKPVFHQANLFARIEKKQLDWLATNTDDITTQSHSLGWNRRKNKTFDSQLQYVASVGSG